MVINLPRDDLGVLRLKEANAAKATTAVSSLTATPRVGSQPYHIPSTPVAAPEERRRGERRRARQRRGQGRHAAVLLDTRSRYERRTHERRHESAGQGQQYSPQGIDVRI
jgi:hypothetical protein